MTKKNVVAIISIPLSFAYVSLLAKIWGLLQRWFAFCGFDTIRDEYAAGSMCDLMAYIFSGIYLLCGVFAVIHIWYVLSKD